MPAINFKQPKSVVRNIVNFPVTVMPNAFTRGISGRLNSLADSIPAGFPIPAPPSPRDIASNIEGMLPSGAPKLSNSIPDVNFQGGRAAKDRGISSDAVGEYRPLDGSSLNARVFPGGYRGI